MFKILIITSCTGKKSVQIEHPLKKEDFQKGEEYILNFENQLNGQLTKAKDLYAGQQHLQLLRGIKQLETNHFYKIDLHILSAGYGLIGGERKIAPYEVTFSKMKKKDLKSWANFLDIPSTFQKTITQQYDLALILLGNKYLEACEINKEIEWGGKTLVLCSKSSMKNIPQKNNIVPIILNNQEAKRFSCVLTALKGKIAARILQLVKTKKTKVIHFLKDSHTLLNLIDTGNTPIGYQEPKKIYIAKPSVKKIITLSDEWKNKTHRKKMRYFIPDWDDMIDPDYDFEKDEHSSGMGGWGNHVYAHQVLSEPCYDGILISKIVAEETKAKKEKINKIGVHQYLRVPKEFPVMGDCGAFGYINEEKPPYTTEEMLDYYTRLGFDYGVSLDHLIVKATENNKQFRYDLTLQNAKEFLVEHKKRGLHWTPIGAIQGWNPKSYEEAAKKCVQMGYEYIAIGGLVRSNTEEIVAIAEAVCKTIPKSINIHLFGLGRISAINTLAKLGISSIDSATHLRRAWLQARTNYWSLKDLDNLQNSPLQYGAKYGAIRIPQVNKSPITKKLLRAGEYSLVQLQKIEKDCLEAVRAYDKSNASLENVLDTLDKYTLILGKDAEKLRKDYKRTLQAQPWKHCPCSICQKDGIEVMLFRGSNRNKRRGFHNTFVFYHFFQSEVTK